MVSSQLSVTCSSQDVTLGEVFAEGGSSKLYRAIHRFFGDVAIKRIKQEAEVVRAFYRPIFIMKQLIFQVLAC
jgi:hypothetical protein